MKKNKLLALLLSSVMVLSVASCDMPLVDPSASSESSTVPSTDTKPTASETTEVPPDLEGYKELTVADVADQDDGKITIYAHNSEFIGLAEKYAGITTDDYRFVQVSDIVAEKGVAVQAFAERAGKDAGNCTECTAVAAHGHIGIIVKEHFAEDVPGGKAFAHILEKIHANAYGMASKTRGWKRISKVRGKVRVCAVDFYHSVPEYGAAV